MVVCACNQKLPKPAPKPLKVFSSAFGIVPKPVKPSVSVCGIVPKPGNPPKGGIGIIPKPPAKGVGIVPKSAFCMSNPLKPGFTTSTVTSGSAAMVSVFASRVSRAALRWARRSAAVSSVVVSSDSVVSDPWYRTLKPMYEIF